MKKFALLFIPAVLCSLSSFAQQKGTETINAAAAGKVDGDEVYTYVEEMPQPNYSLIQFITSHIAYPADARAKNIEGRVIIKMIVDETGRITNAKVEKGLFPSCDAEALRVVSAMPPWRPGKLHGKPVPVYYMLPIKFTLNSMPASQPAPANK